MTIDNFVFKTRGWFYNVYFSSELTNGSNKLECNIILAKRLARDKHASLMDPLKSYEEKQFLWMCPEILKNDFFITFL